MRLSFYGAVDEVTGSCMQLEVADSAGKVHRILIDCGMFQGERLCGSKNFLPFAFDPKQIEMVFVTHAHADHTGRLPKLIREGYTGKITMTRPTVSLTRLVLEDAFHVMKENSKHCNDPMLYAEEDLDGLMERCVGVGYHEAVDVAPGIRVMFHDAGHILGSAYISVDAEGKRVIFSGDIGNDDVPILPPTDHPSHADIVVCESTYGNRVHETHEERLQKLRDSLKKTMMRGGVLVIPAFSVERTQELLYEMDQMLQNEFKTEALIYLDSPMAIRATQIYRDFSDYLHFQADILKEEDRDFFSFPNLRETLNREDSKTINAAPLPKVIMAGSGMMTGGRIMHHLQRYLPYRRNMILIVGYQGSGTLGRAIYDGAKQVNIYGQNVDVKAEIVAIGGFSAHGDKNKLTRWLTPDEGPVPKQIFLTHGDPPVKEEFAGHLRRDLRTNVDIPEFGKVYEI